MFLYSCSNVVKQQEHMCNENMRFKKTFFYNISIVEKYTKEQKAITVRTVTTKAVTKSFQYLSKYVTISDEILNFEYGYPSVERFELDKGRWLKWYETNKCNNLH